MLTVDPVEPLPIVSFKVPTTTPDVIATSTDPVVLPDPILIEPLATSTDETSTTTALTIDPVITPDTAPSTGDVITYYIDKYYEKQWNGVARNHYFLGNINLGIDILSGTNSGVYYVLSDHLGSSSLTTNPFGNMIDRTEYAPYGSIVATAATQNIGNNYKFTSKEADAENNLQYFGARYYDNRVGKFDSIDPLLFQLVSDERVKEKTGLKQSQFLADPQNLSGYSYVRNNPIIYIDPDGHNAWQVMTGQQSLSDYQIEIGQSAQQLYDTNSTWRAVMDHPVATGIVVGIGSGLALGAAFPSSVAAIGASISSSIPTLYNTAVTVGTIGSALLDDTGQSQIPVGTKLGKLGTVIENKPGTITGIFTRPNGDEHALMRILTRSASIKDIASTVGNPLITLQQAGGNVLYLSREAGVVLNKIGEIVTVYGAKEFTPTIINLLSNVK